MSTFATSPAAVRIDDQFPDQFVVELPADEMHLLTRSSDPDDLDGDPARCWQSLFTGHLWPERLDSWLTGAVAVHTLYQLTGPFHDDDFPDGTHILIADPHCNGHTSPKWRLIRRDAACAAKWETAEPGEHWVELARSDGERGELIYDDGPDTLDTWCDGTVAAYELIPWAVPAVRTPAPADAGPPGHVS